MATYNFPPTSRYYGIDTTTLTTPDGRQLSYLHRRFLPSPGLFSLIRLYPVAEDDRLDTIAAKFMDDATLFWRIADANAAMRPDKLTQTIGRNLRITLPQGIPGTPAL